MCRTHPEADGETVEGDDEGCECGPREETKKLKVVAGRFEEEG